MQSEGRIAPDVFGRIADLQVATEHHQAQFLFHHTAGVQSAHHLVEKRKMVSSH